MTSSNRRMLFTLLFAGALTACADQPTEPPVAPALEPNAAFLRNLPRPTVMNRGTAQLQVSGRPITAA